jgi:hypothetical protein
LTGISSFENLLLKVKEKIPKLNSIEFETIIIDTYGDKVNITNDEDLLSFFKVFGQ